MDGKEEKRIKVLELEHQEWMTFMHTLSWIIFTCFTAFFGLNISERMLTPFTLYFFVALLGMGFLLFVIWIHYAKKIRKQISGSKNS